MEATAADASGARDGALGCGATADELCLEKGFAVRGATSGAGALAQRKAAANPSTSKGVYRLEKNSEPQPPVGAYICAYCAHTSALSVSV